MNLELLIESTRESMEELVPPEIAQDIHSRVDKFLNQQIIHRGIDSAIYYGAEYSQHYVQICSMEVERYLNALNKDFKDDTTR